MKLTKYVHIADGADALEKLTARCFRIGIISLVRKMLEEHKKGSDGKSAKPCIYWWR
jgi:hypothetical protein